MTLELKSPDEKVENIRIPTLREVLRKKYGEEWYELEDETISLDMGLGFTPVLVDKVNLLRVLVLEPQLFYEDLLFFLHAVDVFNNEPADFTSFPTPNSLQIAWAVKEIHRVVEGQYSDDIRVGVSNILNHEGFSVAPGPLQEVCFADYLVAGQESEDRSAKEEAVRLYIEHMETWT